MLRDRKTFLKGLGVSLASSMSPFPVHPPSGRAILASCLVGFVSIGIGLAQNAAPKSQPLYLGNWALDLPNGNAGWLSLKDSADGIHGELWTVGAPKPLTDIQVSDETLSFYHRRAVGPRKYPGGPQTGKKIPCRHVARIQGEMMVIVMDRPTDTGSQQVTFTGTRIPPLPPKPNLSKVQFGPPIPLFNGRNLDGWRLTNPEQMKGWKVKDGELVNETPKTTFDPFAPYGNLRTNGEFMDFNLQIEFNVPPGGNSGIYLRGRYEAQVVDRDSRMQGIHGVGAIFNRLAPTGNHGKPGNQWQHYDLTLVNRHITVVLNGKKVIDNEPLIGCTNGALRAHDLLPGPIYLQGDHTSVRYRNIILRHVVGLD